MFTTLIVSALSAGCGACLGALVAFKLSCLKEEKLQKREYLCLLLIVYEELKTLYNLLAAVPAEAVKEIDGVKAVELDMPLPSFGISPTQMQTLMELAPDKQMPAALIKLQHFLKTNALRVSKSGINILEFDFVQQQLKQLEFMLLSVRTQYEQTTGDAFPLDETARK